MKTLAAIEGHDASPDDALVRRARAGDVAAFETLLAPRLDRCYRLAWSILTNEADAADAMQDALVSAWREVPRLRDPAAFDGWLNRVVANAVRMLRRRRERRHEVQVRPATPDMAEPEMQTAQGDERAQADFDQVADGSAFLRKLSSSRIRRRTRASSRQTHLGLTQAVEPRPPPIGLSRHAST